jgi:hypothetical protein
MRVHPTPWIRQAFSELRPCIAFNSCVHLQSSLPDVGETLRIQQKRAITHQDTLAKAKLTDESTLTGPFPQ